MFKKIGSFPPAIVLAALVAAAAGFLTYHGALGTDESAAPSVLSESSSEQEVLGAVIDCAVDPDTQFKFQTEANEFEVVGLLVSFDGTTAVVAGPSGDVTAILAANFELEGALATSGTDSERAVKMEGTVEGGGNVARELESACAGVGGVGCAAGVDPLFKLEVEGNTFEVTGTLNSLTGSLVRVVGPGAIVEAAVDASTEIDIPTSSPGTPVKVEGTVVGPDSFLARQIQSPCEEEEEVEQPEAVLEECNRGPGQAGDFRLRLEDDRAEIQRGTVLSISGNTLEVGDPDGDPSVTVDISNASVEGVLAEGAEVRVRGIENLDGSIDADEVKVLCPHPDDDDDLDQQFENEVDNDEGDERGQDNEGPDDDDGDNSGPSGNSGEDGSGGGGNSGPN